MKINRMAIAFIFLIIMGLLISCSSNLTPSATLEPVVTTEVPNVQTPEPTEVVATLAPSPTEKPEETASPPPLPSSQPAAPPHFQAGEKLTLDYLKMITDTEGWAISGPYVLTTEDGGKSWHEVTPPEPLPEGTLSKAYAAFPDELTAWVIFGFDSIGSEDPRYAYFQIPPEASVWTTNNGGQSWIPGPPLMHEIYGDSTWAEFTAVDDTTAWMMIRGVYVGAGIHYIAQLFRTVDGITWESLDGDVGVDYTGLVFADKDNGWLTWQSTGAYAAAPPEVAVTFDSGFNWEVRDLPPPEDSPDLFERYEYCEPYQPNLLSAESIRLLVACFDYYDPPREFAGYLYVSDDSGESWQTFPLPEKVNGAEYTLIFFDNLSSLLLGRDMYHSEDGGETWELIKTVNWDGQFTFVDDQTGWAIARDGDEIALVQTDDGGATWSQLEPVAVR